MNGRIGTVLRHVRRLAAARHAESTSDRGLLERFVADRDEAAFEALVRQHGPMVLGVCRRVLRHPEDTEDAFQAAFLVLARRAAAVRKADSLGSWLHGVAYRVAANLRRDLARRRAREAVVADPPESAAAAEVSWQDVRVALDEELARLPERFQAPLVLCYLEGKTRDEAARELGWSVGTLRGRLERGRDLLRTRLARRGLALSAALLGVALTHDASAALPATLIGAAVKVAAGAVPAQVAALAGGVLRTMFVAKVKTVALLLFAVMAMGTGGVVLYQAATSRPAAVAPGAEAPVGEDPVAKPQPEAAPPAPAPAADEFGAEVKGLRAKVSLAKEKFAVGEAIKVAYVVKNVSKQELIVPRYGFWPNHLILVHDADGKEPPLTPLGQQRRSYSLLVVGEGARTPPDAQSIPATVPAGSEDAPYEQYDLAKLYDLSKPGRYTVQYIYEEKQGGWEGRLPSNEAAFEVVEKDNKENEPAASKPVRAGEVEFEAIVDRTRLVGEAGAHFNVGLRFTNRGDKPLRISLADTIRPSLKTADGKALRVDGGRDATRRVEPIVVAPGKSETVRWRARLESLKDGQSFRLGWTDGTGMLWYFDGVRPGKYLLHFEYDNSKDDKFWTGKATTNDVEIEVAAPEGAKRE